MNWLLKSKTVFGLIVVVAGAIGGWLDAITPQTAELVSTLGAAWAGFGLRHKQEKAVPK